MNLSSLLVKLAEQDKINITHIKLQKIMFFAYGFVLAKHNIDLVPTGFEAWQYGPVNRELYNILSGKKSDNIKPKDIKDNLHHISLDLNIEDEVYEDINLVWNFYKDINAFDLVKESHRKDSPWDKAYNPNYKDKIDIKDIKEYYGENLSKLEKIYKENSFIAKLELRATSITDIFADTITYLKNT